MNRPTTEPLDAARRLLAHEAPDAGTAEERTAAAVRVHQKMFTRLSTLLGAGGARALLARSVKLSTADFPRLRTVDLDASPAESAADQVATCLRAEPPVLATEAAVALCARMLSLLATLIGEPLTRQVLRGVWPTFDPGAPHDDEENRP